MKFAPAMCDAPRTRGSTGCAPTTAPKFLSADGRLSDSPVDYLHHAHEAIRTATRVETAPGRLPGHTAYYFYGEGNANYVPRTIVYEFEGKLHITTFQPDFRVSKISTATPPT